MCALQYDTSLFLRREQVPYWVLFNQLRVIFIPHLDRVFATSLVVAQWFIGVLGFAIYVLMTLLFAQKKKEIQNSLINDEN